MLPEFHLDWMAACRNVFLIRSPARVVASYVRKRETVALADLGFERQFELFEREVDSLGVRQKGKARVFFFEKKNQKTFTPSLWPTIRHACQGAQP